MQRYIAGIDIGSNNICATLAYFDCDEFSIIHSVSVKSQGIEKGKIVDINLVAQAIIQCCERLNSATNIPMTDYYVGISSLECRCEKTVGSSYLMDDTNIINNKYIDEAIDNMKEITLNPDEDIFDISVESFIIDGEINCNNPINKKGKMLEANGVALICKKEIIHSYKNALSLCKINILGFFSNVNSLRKILLNEKTLDENVLILDIGAQCIDIAFYKKNSLKYLSYIAIGGSNITKDIAVCAGISLEDAERTKIRYSADYRTKFKQEFIEGLKAGSKELDNELFYKIVNARIDEIIKLACKDIYNAGYFGSIDQVYLIGEGLSNFEGIRHLVEDIFNKKIFIVTKNQLGIQISSIINSIGIVKDAYDRLKLDMNNSKTESDYCDKQEDDVFQLKNKVQEKDNSKKSWIKRLIDDIF